MAQILVVERREPGRASALLEREGFTVVTSMNPTETSTVLAGFRPDLVVVEAIAPSIPVLHLCGAIRGATEAPMVLLTDPCSEGDAIAAFGFGVDTLIREPVGDHEFVARVRAQLRRAPASHPVELDTITVGPIVLDRARREVSVAGRAVRLPRREFDIAELLMRDAGRVVSRDRIVRALWGSVRDTKSLDVQVGRLRTRLADVEGRRRIVTVRGVGYRFLLDGDPQLEDVLEPTERSDAAVQAHG
jgi:DNA-binding response OmpR family regulator